MKAMCTLLSHLVIVFTCFLASRGKLGIDPNIQSITEPPHIFAMSSLNYIVLSLFPKLRSSKIFTFIKKIINVYK